MGQGTNAPKKGKKNRKHGRNELFCQRYAQENRCEVNKAKRLYRVLHRTQTPSALAALEAISTTIKQRARRELRRSGVKWLSPEAEAA